MTQETSENTIEPTDEEILQGILTGLEEMNDKRFLSGFHSNLEAELTTLSPNTVSDALIGIKMPGPDDYQNLCQFCDKTRIGTVFMGGDHLLTTKKGGELLKKGFDQFFLPSPEAELIVTI